MENTRRNFRTVTRILSNFKKCEYQTSFGKTQTFF